MNLIRHFHTFRPYTSRVYILHMGCGPMTEVLVRMYVAIHERSNTTRYFSTTPLSYAVNDEHFVAEVNSLADARELSKLGFR